MADDEEVDEESTMDQTQTPPANVSAPETPLNRGTSVITPGKSYQGVPMEQIEELSGIYNEVPVRIQRRNARGQLATLEGMLNVETRSLTLIEVWIKQKHGGGAFRTEVKDPTFPSRVLFSFDFVVEGMALGAPPQTTGPAAASPYANPFGYGPSAPSAPSMPLAIPAGMPNRAWVDGLPGHERAAYVASWIAQNQNAPVAQHSSDQIALEVEARTRAELTRTRSESEAKLRTLELELEKSRQEAVSAREAAKESAHQAELKALSARLDAMNARPPEKGMADTITALAPLVPLGIAWLQSQAAQQQAQLQHQQAGFQTMIAAATPKQQPDSMKELLSTFGPLIMPLISKSMDRDSPEGQAKLFQALAESQLNTVSMMAELAQSTAPPAPSMVGQAIQTTLEGLKNIAMTYVTSTGGLPGQLPAGRQPAGVMRAAASVGGGYSSLDEKGEEVHRGEVVEEPAVSKPAAAAPKPPPSEEQALFSMLPADFQSVEWRTILTHLHTDPPLAAEKVSNLLAGHIEHLANFGLLPAILSGIRENPRATLESVLELLPVTMRQPEYVRKVLDLTLGFLMQDGYVPEAKPEAEKPADQPDDGEDDSGEGTAAEE